MDERVRLDCQRSLVRPIPEFERNAVNAVSFHRRQGCWLHWNGMPLQAHRVLPANGAADRAPKSL